MDKVKDLYENTELTLQQIADETSLKLEKVWRIVRDSYPEEVRAARKKNNYRTSKLGTNNPSYGKTGEEAFNYKGGNPVHDGKGYLMVPKPEWYTGRRGSKYVFQHSVVMCEYLGITEIPQGFVVHHIDKDKTNNELNNLALLSMPAHTRLHQLERATTRRKP